MAIQLSQGGFVNNVGSAAKVQGGIEISGGSGTVANSGTLQGSFSSRSFGFELRDSSQVTDAAVTLLGWWTGDE